MRYFVNFLFCEETHLIFKRFTSKVLLHRLRKILNGIQDHAVGKKEKEKQALL